MPGPLTGLKVLDFTTLLPGPYSTLTFADLGAEVLRVVSGSRPELTSQMPPFIAGTDISANIAWLGRGKKSITLNLKDPRAIEIIHKLIMEYDILIEQFRPGVMAKFGLGYSDLKEVNSALIYASLTGYGQTGPLRDKAGHDINYISRSGIMSYSGRIDTGPSLTGMQIADVASGSNNMTIGVLAALIHRKNSGKGQYIDISMMDGVIAFNAMAGAGYLVDGREPGREKEYLNGGSLYDFYETKDGKYISFGGLEPKFFKAFCNATGCSDLIPGGVTPPDIEQVKERVRSVIREKIRDEWMDTFKDVDACVEPVRSMGEVLDDSQTAETGMVVKVKLSDGSIVRQLGNPIRFSETPQEYGEAGLPAGSHTKDVLLKLGYSEKDIEEFRKTGLFD